MNFPASKHWTMDVSSLYTNIEHEEGADACFEMLEKRINKTVPSSLLKKLILLVLQSNIFRFNEKLYKQIKGTAMGTPMAVNYANIFLDNFENKMLDEYQRKKKVRPIVWWRYIDDVFLIWHDDEESLKDFLKFCDEYSANHKMKSKIKFETNYSRESVNFLDVNIKLLNGKISTSVYSKPTDSHLYLNKKSCHPTHVIENLPKGQFIRIRRICSDIADYDSNANTMKKHFQLRGYDEKRLSKTIETVRKMERDDLLKDKVKDIKDDGRILVLTWHPSLKKASSVLSQNHSILANDIRLNNIFKEKSIVAYRRRKNLKNFLCRNDVREREPQEVSRCRGCQVCRLMNQKETVRNENNGAQIKVKPGGSCKSTGVIYAINCKKCKQIYIGHTGQTIATRWSKHKYDIVNRPEQNELTKHCCRGHNIERDLEVIILDYGYHRLDERERMEDRYICRLQTHQSNKGGMNNDMHAYAKEMYQLWSRIKNLPASPNNLS